MRSRCSTQVCIPEGHLIYSPAVGCWVVNVSISRCSKPFHNSKFRYSWWHRRPACAVNELFSLAPARRRCHYGSDATTIDDANQNFCRPFGTQTFCCASFPSDKSLGYYQKFLRDNVLLNDVVTRICVVQQGR